MDEINITPTGSQEKDVRKSTLAIKILICCAIIAILAVLVWVLFFSASPNSQWLTYANYLKIQTGMSYSQVVNVLDNHSGELTSTSSYGGYTCSIYTWSSGTKSIVVMFDNGAVSTKSQFGLK